MMSDPKNSMDPQPLWMSKQGATLRDFCRDKETPPDAKPDVSVTVVTEKECCYVAMAT